MKKHIWVAGVWGFGNISIMKQFEKDSEVTFLEDDFRYMLKFQKIWKFIRRYLKGCGAGLFRTVLETRIFDKAYALTHCDFEAYDRNYIVLFNSAFLEYYSRGYFERLKKRHPSLRYYLYIIDPMPNGLWPEIERVKGIFDKVLTIHPYNVNKYGFGYLPYIYGKPQEESQLKQAPDVNLFFCGVAGDYRQKIVGFIVDKCREKQISYDLWLKPYGNDGIRDENVHYSEMPYEDNVYRLKHADCILEIMHEGFVGITQRYLEAVIYNKKLLTNNAEIKQLPYYDKRYMQFFAKVEEIDWDWLKEPVIVDYHYKNDFSTDMWKKNLYCIVAEGK